jgi:hypothetical protein
MTLKAPDALEVLSFLTGIIMLMENKSGIENETKLVLRKFHGFFADAFFSDE